MSIEELEPRSNELRKALGKKSGDKPSMPPPMLTIKETCELLRTSRWTVYRLIQDRRLVSVKVGAHRLVSMRSITNFIEQLEAEEGG